MPTVPPAHLRKSKSYHIVVRQSPLTKVKSTVSLRTPTQSKWHVAVHNVRRIPLFWRSDSQCSTSRNWSPDLTLVELPEWAFSYAARTWLCSSCMEGSSPAMACSVSAKTASCLPLAADSSRVALRTPPSLDGSSGTPASASRAAPRSCPAGNCLRCRHGSPPNTCARLPHHVKLLHFQNRGHVSISAAVHKYARTPIQNTCRQRHCRKTYMQQLKVLWTSEEALVMGRSLACRKSLPLEVNLVRRRSCRAATAFRAASRAAKSGALENFSAAVS